MIEKIIKKMIPAQKRTQIMRVSKKMMSRQKSEIFSVPHYDIQQKDQDTFFGYYDIQESKNGNILYGVLNPDGNLDIILGNPENKVKKIGESRAWCWQQGARLQWMPGREENIACWNDFDGTRYFMHFYNVDTGRDWQVDTPLYDISPDSKYGLTLDFVRLGYLRSGYGYTRQPFAELKDAPSEGVDLVDLETGTSRRVVKYQQLAQMLGDESEIEKYYLNHLSFNPSSDKFLLFFIKPGKIHQASLFVYDLKKDSLSLLQGENSVSHYCWIDDHSILITEYDRNRQCRYFVYNMCGGRQPFFPEQLTVDGHPTWINEECVITDTYPDICGYQRVLQLNPKSGEILQLAKLYSTSKRMGDKRTDLHPRVDVQNNRIFVDSNVSGIRKISVLQVNLNGKL